MGASTAMGGSTTRQDGSEHHDRSELLLPRHLGGDPAAFPELIARFGPLVYSVLGRYGLSSEERDDVFQEVFVRVHRAAASYQPDKALKPWLLTVAVNAARSYLRRSRAREFSDGGGAALRLVSDQPSSQALVEASRTLDWLVRRLDDLPLEQREVILLCCVHHLGMQQAAEVLGIPVGTVKTRLHKGRQSLASALERRSRTEAREVGR